MSTKGGHRSKNKKPLQTTLGKAAVSNNNEEIDYSHVRAPIHTSVFGLRHALSLFDTATDEVKRYITYECDIMYECRICRTIYRSLANFVLHKRNYCQQKFTAVITDENNYEENDVEIACVNEVTSRANNGTDENHQTNDSPKSRKNLNSVLEKLNDKQECLKLTEEILNDGNPDREQATVEKIQDNKIALEPIANSCVGVFQSFNKPAQELMKTEAMEIHSMLNTNEAILGPDGTVISIQMENSAANVPKPKLTCAICNLKFSTKKTLTYHIKYKHNNTRVVYICPECKDSFANAWCVFRHLYKVHRKTTTQVRKLRDQIHSSAIIKKQETEVKKKDKPDEVETINNENQWMIDFEGDNDLQMCGGCGKRFERRAALNSHSQLCMKRLAVCNTIKENSKRNQIDEKVNKPKGCDPPVLRGSKKRKPNILRKTRRDIYVENETIEENSVTNENKLPETISNQDPVIELKESSLMMNVEPAVDDMQTRDEITVTPQDGSEMKDFSEKTKDDAYKRTAIEEIIFGTREDGEECNESKEDVPIISDDEDVLGFPPASNKLELKVPDKPNEELVESNINNIECTIKNLFNEKIYNKVADEVIEKTKEIISQIIVENRDVISTECLDNFNEVINKDCVGNVGEVEKDMISEECADNINKQPDKEIKYDHTSDEQIGIHDEEINKLQFHEVTSINESNQIISEETHGAIRENFNVNVPKDVESVGSSTENKSISVNFEDLNIISDNEVSDANSECKNVCISKKRKLIELTNSVSNDHVYSTHTDVSGNVINTKEIELTRSSTETLENNSSNVEDLQKNVQAVCDTRSGSKEDVCVSTKRKIIELIQSISNDHLYTPRNDNERGWKKPNILRKPKPIVKQPKLNLSKADAGFCESKISNDLVAVKGEHAVFEFPVRLSIEHLTRMQNMTVLPTIPISIASVESDDDKFPRLVSLSTDNETNVLNLSITSTSPTGNINNFTNKEIQDDGFDAQETVYELNIQNVMSTKDNVENKYDDLSAVINEYRLNDSEHLDQKEINDKVEQKNIYSLYNNHDIENRENDVQTKEDINDNVEYINDNFKLHCDRELRYKSKKQGQKRRHSMSTEQDVTEISLELKSRKYIDSDKLVCVPCKFTFSSKKYLMRHMSLHFNWFRYQCSKCAFMSYEKLTCHQHSKTHNVSELLIRNIVMPIPNWKTVSLSRNFTNIIDRKCSDESNQNAVEDMKEDPPQDDDIECINDIQTINKQDPMLRKMIMEVIFGSDPTPANAEEKAIINSDTRPVRSRPVVPNFQKDFVYDMKQVDTEMETRKSSFQAKVKPFKIVKSTDANFKVVHINDPTGKKKKPNTEKEPS